jgi:small membrane protein
MHAIQVLMVGFFVFAASRAVVRLRRGQSSVVKTVLWLLVWAGAIVVVMQPEMTVAFARVLGVTRGVDVPIYLSVAMLFFLVFRAFARIEDMERQLTRVVRDRALQDFQQRLPPATAPDPAASEKV